MTRGDDGHRIEFNIGAHLDGYEGDHALLQSELTGLMIALRAVHRLLKADNLEGQGERSYTFTTYAHDRHLASIRVTLGDAEQLSANATLDVVSRIAEFKPDVAWVVKPAD
jgi:hypothetical protein